MSKSAAVPALLHDVAAGESTTCVKSAVIDNALHAASTWLERLLVAPTAAVVVTIAPHASVGVWIPGQPNVGTLAGIDDPAAELCEAVAPAVQHALEALTAEPRNAALEAVAAGARLQLVVIPSAGELALRVVADLRAVVLASMRVGDLR